MKFIITLILSFVLIAGNSIDYYSGPYTVNVTAEETKNAVLNIPIIDDNKLEMDENFSVIITSTSQPEKVFISSGRSQAVVFIVNDDIQGKMLSVCF